MKQRSTVRGEAQAECHTLTIYLYMLMFEIGAFASSELITIPFINYLVRTLQHCWTLLGILK